MTGQHKLSKALSKTDHIVLTIRFFCYSFIHSFPKFNEGGIVKWSIAVVMISIILLSDYQEKKTAAFDSV